MDKCICFYRFPLIMKDFLYKTLSLYIKDDTSIKVIWIDPKKAKIKIREILNSKEDSDLENNNLESLIDERRRAVIFFSNFERSEISQLVGLLKKAVRENYDLIFSTKTETNSEWTFERLWQDVVEDHSYFKELEKVHKEGRPFTLVPDDDKPTAL